jgi:hypothetical protein
MRVKSILIWTAVFSLAFVAVAAFFRTTGDGSAVQAASADLLSAPVRVERTLFSPLPLDVRLVDSVVVRTPEAEGAETASGDGVTST